MVRITIVWMVVAWIVTWIVARIVAPMVWVVAHIPVPVVPRVVRIAPHCIVEWRGVETPTKCPWRCVDAEGNICSSPRAKHRGHILRLYPHLISRHHDVVVCRVVCRSIAHSITRSQSVVARWQTICRRVKAIETACIGTLIVICKDSIVVLARSCIILRLSTACLPHSLACLSLSPLGLSLSL